MRNIAEEAVRDLPSVARRWVIYCRISDDREGKRYGVQRQEKDCRRLQLQLGGVLVEVLIENDTSAFKPKTRREKYGRLLEMLRSGEANGVIALTSRRLQRQFKQAFEFLDLVEEKGIAVATVKGGMYDLTTADGRREARRKAIDDQHESEEISEHVRDAKADFAAQGVWGGGRRPLCFESDGVTVRKADAEGLRWAADQILKGTYLRAAVRKLAADGMVTASGKPVGASDLRRALINPRYIGKRVYRPASKPKLPQAHYADDEIVADAEWPAILNEEVFDAVRALLMNPERRPHDKAGQRVWLGSGLYLCGRESCDSTVKITTSRGRHPQPAQYACKLGGHVSRQAGLTDECVRASVAELLTELPPVTDDQVDRAAELDAKQRGLRARLDELARQFSADLIDGEQLAAGSRPLRAELEVVKTRRGELPHQAALKRVTDRADAVAAFLSGDLDYQRLTIDTLVTVTLLPAKKGRPAGWRPGQPYFDPETISVVPK
jgi:site-specific DNA recombinase